MKYCYSNNGLSWRCVDDGYAAQDGEYLSAALLADAEITAQFSSYNPAQIALKAQARELLEKTDASMRRLSEAIILGKTTATTPDVVAFVTACQTIRNIALGKDTTTTTLPTLVYPVGT